MPNRQTEKPSPVHQDTEQTDSADRAAYLGRRIRERLRELGWSDETDGQGRNDSVGRLREEIAKYADKAPRWQTVQDWVEGRKVPSTRYRYESALARALGMSLDELAGLALGHEPQTKGWLEFVQGELGQGMSSEERSILAASRAPLGRELTAGYFRTQLINLRSSTVPKG